MKLGLIILGALSFCGFAGWCFCKAAGDADREAEEASWKSMAEKRRADPDTERFAEIVKRVAKEEFGTEVTVRKTGDGEPRDTFESLFGVSVEDLKRMAEGDDRK